MQQVNKYHEILTQSSGSLPKKKLLTESVLISSKISFSCRQALLCHWM